MIISAAKASQAAEILGVEIETLDAAILGKAFRIKAKGIHPDVATYDAAKWAELEWAKECLKRWLERAPPPAQSEPEKGDCTACGGVGRIPVKSSGFGKPMTVQCVMCLGSGAVAEGQRGFYGRSE
jgi:hypothetical protein